ncbi:MAG: hypothetical protein ACXQT3_01555 [Methermicoccaceae archaeon]
MVKSFQKGGLFVKEEKMKMGRIVRHMTEATDVIVYYVTCPYCLVRQYGRDADDVAARLVEHLNECHSEVSE